MADTKKKTLIVSAPLVGVVDEGGRMLQLYRGASLDGVKQSEIERLIGLGMVGEDATVIPGVALDPNRL
jgi:hypothetical protein